MEYKGDLKDFPQEIVEKMLERQAEQGNSRDVSIFEVEITADRRNGGFSWISSPEGHNFWHDVIRHKDFETFFNLYPKEKIFPKWMMVSNCPLTEKNPGQKRKVFMYKNHQFISWAYAETEEEVEKCIVTRAWPFAIDIPQEIKEVTLQEIAEKFNVPVSQIRIKK